MSVAYIIYSLYLVESYMFFLCISGKWKTSRNLRYDMTIKNILTKKAMNKNINHQSLQMCIEKFEYISINEVTSFNFHLNGAFCLHCLYYVNQCFPYYKIVFLYMFRSLNGNMYNINVQQYASSLYHGLNLCPSWHVLYVKL